ncbi:MAG TPA: L-threonylcarbamoyladenylate synthase [Bacillota bacterium]|nr:L-threonylcarbamoyladenylate synthase [Bacillota bacterium]
MKQTKRWRLSNDDTYNQKAIAEAANMLRDGMTVAFPTETVYGLGADATNDRAVQRIFLAKGRPADNPLIAHVASKEQLLRLVATLPTYAEMLIDTFTPGPITFVLPHNNTCARSTTAGLATIGVRIPDHPVARALLQACDRPIAAPSANTSGKPSPTTADHVWSDLHGKISGLLDAGPAGVGVESTVIDCTEAIPVILRPGGITKEQLEQVAGSVMVDPSLADKAQTPKSPGMKYRHYAPDVPLWLVKASMTSMQQLIDRERRKEKRVGVLAGSTTANQLKADRVVSLGDDIRSVAAHLYDGLRSFKEGDVDLIVCEAFPETDIGQAVMNRLQKAASCLIEES